MTADWAEVDRGGSVVDLVRQDGQLVINPLSNREPTQLLAVGLKTADHRRPPQDAENNNKCVVFC